MYRSLLFVIAAMISTVPAGAADLGYYRTSACVSYRQSTLPNLDLAEIRRTVGANLADAISAMSEPGVLASTRPSFVWAMEARWACSAAVGYIDGGNLNIETVQKCDCFFQRYLAFR